MNYNPKELANTYDRIAVDWDNEKRDDDWWVVMTEKFIGLVPEDGLILDAGCGSGIAAKKINDSNRYVIGIDFSKEMLRLAVQAVPDGGFILCDMRDVKKLGCSFDGVYIRASLLHIPKRESLQVFQKLCDVLSPSGYLYLAVKQPKPDGPAEEEVVESNYGYEYRRFFSYYTFEEVCAMAQLAQLQILHADVGQKWIQIIAQKP